VRLVVFAVAVILAAASDARAQVSGAAFLPRAEWGFAWNWLHTPDTRFEWLGEFVLDVDLVDYGTGRARFQAEVEGGLGGQRRRYDLNHGNYWFDFSTTYRLTPQVEIGAVFQHVSRHLVDREQPPSISYNATGARVRYHWRETVDAELEIGWTHHTAFVDYAWVSKTRIEYQHPVGRHAVFATATGDVMAVDVDLRGRGRVCGGRIEGGFRIGGDAAAVELFAGYERRVDAFPTDRFRVRWVTLGFRIVSR
jgi:hypothetical protein